MNGDEDFRSTKYSIDKLIGSGACSIVWQGTNRKTGKVVAIKKLTSVFRTLDDAKHTLREIKLLRHLRHENVIQLLDIVTPVEGKDRFEDLYLVFELMTTDLTKLLSASQHLEMDHVRLFIYQILRGLKYVHSAGVIHRDLKPSNILVQRDCTTCIADFGSGRSDRGNRQLKMTHMEMTTTRWYRAPEGILHAKNYTSAVDVWSVGCILGELLLRQPLFPGTTNSEMVTKIFSFLGTECVDVEQVENEKYKELLRTVTQGQRQSFAAAFAELGNAPADALELLGMMLVYPPEKRVSVAEALAHPFFGILHDEEDEPVAQSSVSNDWESAATLEDYRTRIWQDVVAYEGEKLR